MGRLALTSLFVFAAACGRSGIKLVDTGDGDALGGSMATGGSDTGGNSTGGTVATGGAGNAPGTGGSGGSMPPPNPSGPVPNCTSDSPLVVTRKTNRWLFLNGRPSAQPSAGRHVVELTPSGPRNLTLLGFFGAFGGWSHDGRFLVTTGGSIPRPFEVFDCSTGSPVRVALPERSGEFAWSRTGSRYAVELDTATTLSPELVVVDAETTTERRFAIPVDVHLRYDAWSPDDRFVALAGPGGLVLVDVSVPELTFVAVSGQYVNDLSWSPDGRYLAFVVNLGPGDSSLYVFDTVFLHLKVIQPVWGRSLFYGWAGNAALVFEELGGHSSYVNVAPQYPEPVALADHGMVSSRGAISPGHKCYAYHGLCGTALEDGICVRSLPPDDAKPAVLVQRPAFHDWSMTWSGNGDHLLLRANIEPWLIDLELAGGKLTGHTVTLGTMTTNVDEVVGWNPNGGSNWLAYFARPTGQSAYDDHLRLWNGEGATFYVYFDGKDAESWAWSADGRYLAVETSGEDAEYYVEEVLEERLEGRWRVEGIVAPDYRALWETHMQP